jgi:protein-S-isoprenylcysteine O-methyltransferase Ste14
VFGIGPYLIYGIALLHAVVIYLTSYIFKAGIAHGVWIYLYKIAGAALIGFGLLVWFVGAIKSGMDKNITENILKTDGIYAWVRNPMYSGIWLLIIGISFMWHNIYILPFLFVDWLIITDVLKNTEEKWLLDLYGEEYKKYKVKVNRIIPWIPKR